MAKVDFWVMVEKDHIDEKWYWNSYKMITEPDVMNLDATHKWIQLDDSDDLYVQLTWDFENGPMPKKLRGATPKNYQYDVDNDKWVFIPVPAKEWIIVRNARDARLQQTDWIVTKSIETGTEVPAEWMEYRQKLRDFPQTYKDLSAEEAEHILNHMYDPDAKANRIKLGLSLDIPPYLGE